MGGKRDKRKKDPAAKAAKQAKQQAKASKVRPAVRWLMLARLHVSQPMSASASTDRIHHARASRRPRRRGAGARSCRRRTSKPSSTRCVRRSDRSIRSVGRSASFSHPTAFPYTSPLARHCAAPPSPSKPTNQPTTDTTTPSINQNRSVPRRRSRRPSASRSARSPPRGPTSASPRCPSEFVGVDWIGLDWDRHHARRMTWPRPLLPSHPIPSHTLIPNPNLLKPQQTPQTNQRRAPPFWGRVLRRGGDHGVQRRLPMEPRARCVFVYLALNWCVCALICNP